MIKFIYLSVIALLSIGFGYAQRPNTKSPEFEVKNPTALPAKTDTILYRDLRLVRKINLPSLNRENYEPWAGVIVFSPDNKTLASGLVNFGNPTLADLILWDTETGRVNQALRSGNTVNSISYTENGNLIASASTKIQFWNAITGENLRNIEENTRSLTISPDGKTIVGGGYECSDCEDPAGVIRIWDLQSGRQKKMLDFGGSEHAPSSVAFSPDGSVLASVSSSIWLWRTKNWSLIRKLKPSYEIRSPAVFSPNGNVIASAGGVDGKRGDVTLWNVVTGKLLRKLQGHNNLVNSVAFSPDGKTIASGSHDGTVKLWDVGTGKLLTTLITLKPRLRNDGVKDNDLILSVAFSSNGKTFAAGSTDGAIRIWKIPE